MAFLKKLFGFGGRDKDVDPEKFSNNTFDNAFNLAVDFVKAYFETASIHDPTREFKENPQAFDKWQEEFLPQLQEVWLHKTVKEKRIQTAKILMKNVRFYIDWRDLFGSPITNDPNASVEFGQKHELEGTPYLEKERKIIYENLKESFRYSVWTEHPFTDSYILSWNAMVQGSASYTACIGILLSLGEKPKWPGLYLKRYEAFRTFEVLSVIAHKLRKKKIKEVPLKKFDEIKSYLSEKLKDMQDPVIRGLEIDEKTFKELNQYMEDDYQKYKIIDFYPKERSPAEI